MKYFEDHEFACKCGCGLGVQDVDPALLMLLDALREGVGEPMRINSAVRCAQHNARVGGSSRSEHVPSNTHSGKTTGVDVHIPSSTFCFKLIRELNAQGVPRIGLNQDKNFVHIGISLNHPQNVFFKY